MTGNRRGSEPAIPVSEVKELPQRSQSAPTTVRPNDAKAPMKGSTSAIMAMVSIPVVQVNKPINADNQKVLAGVANDLLDNFVKKQLPGLVQQGIEKWVDPSALTWDVYMPTYSDKFAWKDLPSIQKLQQQLLGEVKGFVAEHKVGDKFFESKVDNYKEQFAKICNTKITQFETATTNAKTAPSVVKDTELACSLLQQKSAAIKQSISDQTLLSAPRKK